MSIIGCMVVKGFSTCIISEHALCETLLTLWHGNHPTWNFLYPKSNRPSAPNPCSVDGIFKTFFLHPKSNRLFTPTPLQINSKTLCKAKNINNMGIKCNSWYKNLLLSLYSFYLPHQPNYLKFHSLKKLTGDSILTKEKTRCKRSDALALEGKTIATHPCFLPQA